MGTQENGPWGLVIYFFFRCHRKHEFYFNAKIEISVTYSLKKLEIYIQLVLAARRSISAYAKISFWKQKIVRCDFSSNAQFKVIVNNRILWKGHFLCLAILLVVAQPVEHIFKPATLFRSLAKKTLQKRLPYYGRAQFVYSKHFGLKSY